MCVYAGSQSKKSGQLQQLGRVKPHTKKGDICDVPPAWEAHFNEEYKFTCLHVFESIVRKTIKPLYDSSGRQLVPISAEPGPATHIAFEEPSLVHAQAHERDPESSGSDDARSSVSSDTESD